MIFRVVIQKQFNFAGYLYSNFALKPIEIREKIVLSSLRTKLFNNFMKTIDNGALNTGSG
ncbi:hypothetical protein Riv7116_6531 [Rivularia sp. PCC 7116]|nr:hypothetical protein Riv7116_6531 [Rivularia sp. PCC 7116]